jgi:hypothetical protein
MVVPTIACCMLKTISAGMINLVNEENNERQPIGGDDLVPQILSASRDHICRADNEDLSALLTDHAFGNSFGPML